MSEPINNYHGITTLRAACYVIIALSVGITMMYASNLLFFGAGKYTGRAEIADWKNTFFKTLEAKIPVEENGLMFYPNTHDNTVQVQKVKRKKASPVHGEVKSVVEGTGR